MRTPPDRDLALVKAGAATTCPICARPDVAIVRAMDHAAEVIAIAVHRVGLPVMAYKSGTGSCGNMEFVDRRMFRARCPGSLAPITEVCDGDHAAPKCTDPVCWRDDDPDPANVAFPRGIKPSHSVSYDTETTGIDPSHAVAPVVTAVCSCGWRGPERAKIIEAGIDAGGHIKEVGAKSAEAST